MRPAIKNYLRNCLKGMRPVFLALAVGLMFAAVDVMKGFSSGEKVAWTKILPPPAIYSLSCFLSIWILFCIAHAVYEIKFRRELKETLLLSTVLSFMGMSIGLVLARYFHALYDGRPPSFSNMGGAFLFGTFITLMFLFYYSYKKSSEENLKLKALNAQSELHVLKNQMRPHFLFNTLNGLSELIMDDPEKAGKMAQMLADLYREILENSKHKTVQLSAEISLVKKYVHLEKARYEERLEFSLNCPEGENLYVPALLLQTLVENAIKHGISPSIKGGKIEVNIVHANNGLQISVENTGGPFIAGLPGKGTGLANSIGRLQLLYGDRHNFKIQGGEKTLATFWITGDKIV